MSKEYIRINIPKKHLKASFRYMSFKENDSTIIYIPGLKISGYGDTYEEAEELLKISLDDFSENLFTLKDENKIFSVLKTLGWMRDRLFNKRMTNLSKTTFEDIRKQFNIPDKTIVKEGLIEV